MIEILPVTTSESLTPSETWKVKVSEPFVFAVGVYVKAPVDERVSIPCVTLVSRIYVSGVHSISDPVRTSASGVSSEVVKAPEYAVGGVL